MDRNRTGRRKRNDQERDDLGEPSFFHRVPETPDEGVDADVLWFNEAKGFGFVQLADGSKAFLHVRQLEAAGYTSVAEGARIKVAVIPSDKGPQVAKVLQVLAAPAPAAVSQKRATVVEAAAEEVVGTVKWYDADKGFGFIGRADGGKDIFVHASALGRCGLVALIEGQQVHVRYAEGVKGLEARSLRLK